jgi:hypothetical protein
MSFAQCSTGNIQSKLFHRGTLSASGPGSNVRWGTQARFDDSRRNVPRGTFVKNREVFHGNTSAI